jgi:hypothetical protein
MRAYTVLLLAALAVSCLPLVAESADLPHVPAPKGNLVTYNERYVLYGGIGSVLAPIPPSPRIPCIGDPVCQKRSGILISPNGYTFCRISSANVKGMTDSVNFSGSVRTDRSVSFNSNIWGTNKSLKVELAMVFAKDGTSLAGCDAPGSSAWQCGEGTSAGVGKCTF